MTDHSALVARLERFTQRVEEYAQHSGVFPAFALLTDENAEMLREALAALTRPADGPKPEAADLDVLVEFASNEAKKLRSSAASRLDAAASWSGGDDASHEYARKLAQRMGGRKLPRMSSDERDLVARRERRIADKLESEAQMFDRITAALRRAAPAGGEEGR